MKQDFVLCVNCTINIFDTLLFSSDGGEIKNISQQLYDDCKECLEKIREFDPQGVINGIHNTWILKPGAKSRGRGIQVVDKLGICLSQAESEPSMVIQKYIGKFIMTK